MLLIISPAQRLLQYRAGCLPRLWLRRGRGEEYDQAHRTQRGGVVGATVRYPFYDLGRVTAQVKISQNFCPRGREGLSTLRKDDLARADDLAESGRRLYDERLKALLDPGHEGKFVAIDPETKRYSLGQTGLDALKAGKRELPDKLFYLLRVAVGRLQGVG
jgi:hypothetical protein